MRRSLLVCITMKVTPITAWVRELNTNSFAAIVSGLDPDDVPEAGTFYDFFRRLWLSDQKNFSPAEHQKKERPSKPKRKGEKAAPTVKKPVEGLIQALEDDPGDLLAPCRLLWQILSIFLQRSADKGLLDLNALVLAGDGTPVRTGARERSKPTCSCRDNGITDCKCDRCFQQPDCDWGWDSHRDCYFFGYPLYLLTDPSSKHDLPFPGTGIPARFARFRLHLVRRQNSDA